jgi:phage tail sheath protein FI
VYYPHVYIKDPVGRSGASVRKIGPSGAVAGLFLETDRKVGPFKSPAGIEVKITDAIALERSFSSSDLDALNSGVTESGLLNGKNVVNAIRNVPGAGVVIMGARTLKQDGTANRYINMRRSLTYLEKRLNDLASFAVFENNTETLWARLITVIGVFLNEYRNQGGLRGTTIEQSYYIKCDNENNTAASIQAGEVHIEVGVALEYPAEFVVINLSQKTAE